MKRNPYCPQCLKMKQWLLNFCVEIVTKEKKPWNFVGDQGLLKCGGLNLWDVSMLDTN